MRYLLTIALAFSLVGVANAAGIPTATDPQNQPEIWTVNVYNNDTVALTSGTVVVWACSADTGDSDYAYRTMWVDQTTTTDDINVAGVVVSDSIAASGVGTICVWGPVYARVADSTDAVTADEAIGTTSVEGECGGADAADNKALLGWSIYAAPVATTSGGYGGTDGNDFIMQPIFVDPTPMVN
jgi:hypothetical protein